MTGLLRGFGFSSKATTGFGGTIITQPTMPVPPPTLGTYYYAPLLTGGF